MNQLTDTVFKRNNFFTGLMASPKFWNELEEYHYLKERLYNSLFHGIGIVPGYKEELKVTTVKKPGNLTLVVGTGVAFDGQGRSIFVYEPQAKVIDPKKFKLPGTVFVTLSYNEVLDEYYQNRENPDYQGYLKKVETSVIDISSKQPDNNLKIELCRIYLEENENGEIVEISDPNDPINPKANEIDSRFVYWTSISKRGLSPYLRKYLTDILNDTKLTAEQAGDAVNLSGLRELQTVALTAKMLVECESVSYDNVIHVLYPIYDVNQNIIQEMIDYDRDKEKRIFTIKDSFNTYRRALHEMGDLIKYYDQSIETIDRVIKCLKEVLDSIKNIIESRKITLADIALLSYDLPRILIINDERYTMIDYMDFNDPETDKNYDFETVGIKDFTGSKHSFSYPDGIHVKDTVKRYAGGTVSFTLRNLVKKRELIIIKRTDIFHGNYSVQVDLNNETVGSFTVDGYDSKNRWRNLSMIIDENLITSDTNRISFKMGENGRDNFGTIWFYQKL